MHLCGVHITFKTLMGFPFKKTFLLGVLIFPLAQVLGLYPALPRGAASIHQFHPTIMHPDAGAIIGISLAGTMLLLAILILCILHLPCCQMKLKSRRPPRPSTSSRTAISSLRLSESSRNIRELSLSAMDLHAQNQAHFVDATGIINPFFHYPCHSCESLASHHHHHQCQYPPSSNASCHGWHTIQQVTSHQTLSNRSPRVSDSVNFEYMVPQLLSPSDSPPPPYNDAFNQETAEDVSRQNPSSQSNPPPYSPKRTVVPT